MTQHDQVVDNANGLSFRNDINAALKALFTTSSGATEPTTKVAGQLWFDTSVAGTNVLKVRDQTNSFWIIVPLGSGAAPIPVNSVAPVVTGSLPAGSVLTSSNGTWSNSPTAYSYQWKSGGTNVGTNAGTYTSVAGDVGKTITCTVTASNSAGAGVAATSAAFGPVTTAVVSAPVISAIPVVSGSLVAGSTLTSTTGTWTNSPTSYAYQWKSAGTNVGTNSNTYVTVSGDVTKTITCTVTASNAGGASTGSASAAVGPITAQPVPVNSVVPVVSGSLVAGSALSSTTGTWSNTPTSYAYQWKSAGTNVGTNANSYTTVVGDVGKTITCTVTASNAGGAGTAAASTAVGPITASGAVPTVVQQVKAAAKVTTTTPAWSPAPTSGNLLVAVVNCEGTITTPAGWTLGNSQVSNMGSYMFYRFATGGAQDTPSFTASAANAATAVHMAEFNNLSGTTLLAQSGQLTVTNGSAHFAQNSASFTPSAGATLVIMGFCIGDTTLDFNAAGTFPQNGFRPVGATTGEFGTASLTGTYGSGIGCGLCYQSLSCNGTTPTPLPGAYISGNPGGQVASDVSIMQLAFRSVGVAPALGFVNARDNITPSTTGAVLRAVTGNISGDRTLTIGQTLTDTHVTGALIIGGKNVTIQNCIVDQGIYVQGGADCGGLSLTYTEITGGGGASTNGLVIDGTNAGGASTPLLVDHCYIHCKTPGTSFNMEDGVHLSTSYTTYSNNLVTGLFNSTATPHYDCFQVGSTITNLTMDGNHHYNNTHDTSGLAILQTAGGVFTNVRLTNNWGSGAPQCLIFEVTNTGGSQTGTVITGNGWDIPAAIGMAYLDATSSGGALIDQSNNSFFIGLNI